MRRRIYLASTASIMAGLSGCVEGIEGFIDGDGDGDDCGPGSDEIETVSDNWDVFEEEIVSFRGEIVNVLIDSDDFGTAFGISDTTGIANIIPSRENVDDVRDLESGMCVNVTGKVPSTDSVYYNISTAADLNLAIIGARWSFRQ